MSKVSFIDIIRSIVKQPTAPFCEGYVKSSIYRFIDNYPLLKYSEDQYGNILIKYDGNTSSKVHRTIFTAHLDHPGFRWEKKIDLNKSIYGVYGGINKNLLMNHPVLVYNPAYTTKKSSNKGHIRRIFEPRNSRIKVEIDFETDQKLEYLKQSFCCLDVTPWRVYGHRLHARSCDDLVGVGVALSTIAGLSITKAQVKAGVLLTRAEEVGFAGMLGALKDNYLSKKDLYLNIECSSIRAGATLGAGPIVRVGDRIKIFNPNLTSALTNCAKYLQNMNSDFSFQRKLMDGGACEATPLVNFGYKTGAVAIPLDNYHNDGVNKLKAEIVDLRDVQNLITLLTTFCLSQAVTEEPRKFTDIHITEKMEETFSRYYQDLLTLPELPK